MSVSFVRAVSWASKYFDHNHEAIAEYRNHETAREPQSSEEGEGVWVLLHYVSTNDVDGDAVGRSNLRVFERDHGTLFEGDSPDAVMVTGAYGSRTVAIRWEAYDHRPRSVSQRDWDEENLSEEELARLESWDSLADAIASLADYPILDESDWSEVEAEEEQEQWADWGRRDFQRALAKAHPAHEDAIDAAADATLDRLWWQACEASGQYPEHCGGGVHFPVDRVVREVDSETLAAALAA